MKILWATDLSEQAAQAGRVAADLARRFGDTLTIFHVLETPSANVLELRADARVFESALREAAAAQLDKVAAELRARGATVETRLGEGSPEEVIPAQAATIGARLVIVGSHGHRAPWRWFLGKVAERVVRLSDCPVLVVREAAEGFSAWAAGQRPLRVVVGFDVNEPATTALDWVADLRRAGPCETVLVYAVPAFARDPKPEAVAVLQRELAEHAEKLPGEGDVSFRVVPHQGNEAAALARVAEDLRADLVVVGTHQRRGLDLLWNGSVAQGLLHSTGAAVCVPIPVAQARAEAEPEIAHVRTVVAATDLTAAGNRAVRFAYALPRMLGKVVLLHVLPPASDDDERRRARDHAMRQLAALVPTEAPLWGIDSRLLVVEGTSVADAIARAAREAHAEAICLTTALRGTADRVVELAGRPVFVIPPNDVR